jgi:hypothetical protein
MIIVDFFLALFMLSSFWGILSLVVCAIILMAIMEKRLPFFAALFFFIMLATFAYANGFNLIHRAIQYPLLTIGCVVGYFAIGFVWAFIRFDWIASDAAKQYASIRDAFTSNVADLQEMCDDSFNSKTTVTQEKINQFKETGEWNDKTISDVWANFFRHHFQDSRYVSEDVRQLFPTDFRQFYSSITCWVMFWCLDIIIVFMRDWVIDLIHTITKKLSCVFDWISLRHARRYIPKIDDNKG